MNDAEWRFLSDVDNLNDEYGDVDDDDNTDGKNNHNIDNHVKDHKDKDDKGKHDNDKPTMTKMYKCLYPKTLKDSVVSHMQNSYESIRGFFLLGEFYRIC